MHEETRNKAKHFFNVRVPQFLTYTIPNLVAATVNFCVFQVIKAFGKKGSCMPKSA